MAQVAPIGKSDEDEKAPIAATAEPSSAAPTNQANNLQPTLSNARDDRIVREKSRKATDKVIAKVKDPAVKTDWAVEEEIELWVKLKLIKWDKDQNGQFSMEEVEAAMEELKETEAKLAGMKWRIIFVFVFMLCFLAFVSGTVAVAFALTKNTQTKDDGEMRAPNNREGRGEKYKHTELVATTQSRGDLDLSTMLNYDSSTDQWTIDDDSLRQLDTVSFWHTGIDTFYHFDLAEIIRIDSGPSGTNDKLEMVTTSGAQLRVWENVGELEVLWPNSTMWEGITVTNQSSGGRLLADDVSPHFAEDQDLLQQELLDADDDFMKDQPAERRLGKGGTRVFYGGGGGHYNNGGSSSGCQGWCNVPHGDTGSCRNYCQYDACYQWAECVICPVATYKCNDSGAVRMAGGPSLSWWLSHMTIAVALITWTFQDSF